MTIPLDVLDGAATQATTTAWRPAAPRESLARLRPVVGGASLVLGGTLVGQASNFAFNAVGAHALGPSRYGVLAASLALLSFATPLLTAVQSAASRQATSLVTHGSLGSLVPMLRRYGVRAVLGTAALGVAVVAMSRWIAGIFHLGSPWLVVIVAVVVPCSMASHLLGGVLQGTERFGRFAVESVVEGLTKAAIGALAVGILWRSAVSGMVAVAVSCVTGLVTYVALARPVLLEAQHAPPALPRPASAAGATADGEDAGVVSYSLAALVTYGLLALMLSSDTLVAKHYLSGHQAGIYAGVSLTGKIVYFAAASLCVVAFPIFSRHHDEGVEGTRPVLVAGGLVLLVGALIVTAFALRPAWVVVPLLGNGYRSAEPYVPWMAAVFALYALGFMMSTYLLAQRRWGVIGVLALAACVQFGGFFAFHSTVTRLIGVLAAAFAVMAAGAAVLVAIGRDRGATARGAAPLPSWAEVVEP